MQRLSRSVALTAAAGLLCPAAASAQPSSGGPSRTPAVSMETALALSAGGIVFSALVAALLIYAAREFTLSTADYVRTDPVETAVVGFVSLVAAFVVTVLLVFTVVGAVLAVPLAASLVLALIPGIVVTEIAVGRELCEKLRFERRRADAPATLWIWFAVGAAVVTGLGAVPILNVLAIAAVWTLAVGAVVQHVRLGSCDADESGGRGENRDGEYRDTGENRDSKFGRRRGDGDEGAR